MSDKDAAVRLAHQAQEVGRASGGETWRVFLAATHRWSVGSAARLACHSKSRYAMAGHDFAGTRWLAPASGEAQRRNVSSPLTTESVGGAASHGWSNLTPCWRTSNAGSPPQVSPRCGPSNRA